MPWPSCPEITDWLLQCLSFKEVQWQVVCRGHGRDAAGERASLLGPWCDFASLGPAACWSVVHTCAGVLSLNPPRNCREHSSLVTSQPSWARGQPCLSASTQGILPTLSRCRTCTPQASHCPVLPCDPEDASCLLGACDQVWLGQAAEWAETPSPMRSAQGSPSQICPT